jgi:hypothetical protein
MAELDEVGMLARISGTSARAASSEDENACGGVRMFESWAWEVAVAATRASKRRCLGERRRDGIESTKNYPD